MNASPFPQFRLFFFWFGFFLSWSRRNEGTALRGQIYMHFTTIHTHPHNLTQSMRLTRVRYPPGPNATRLANVRGICTMTTEGGGYSYSISLCQKHFFFDLDFPPTSSTTSMSLFFFFFASSKDTDKGQPIHLILIRLFFFSLDVHRVHNRCDCFSS